MPHEGPALIGEVAVARGLEVSIIRTDLGHTIPRPDELEGISGLMVLGGAMGALDDAEHPHLRAERELVAAAIEQGTPVLGVCLGAQILALAAGGELLPGRGSEVGLGTVTLTDAGSSDAVLGPAGRTVPVFHWHDDTVTLPEGAVLLAGSDACEIQAFRLGPAAYGFQFHVEMGPDELAPLEGMLPPDADRDPRRAHHVAEVGRPIIERYFEVVAGHRTL